MDSEKVGCAVIILFALVFIILAVLFCGCDESESTEGIQTTNQIEY